MSKAEVSRKKAAKELEISDLKSQTRNRIVGQALTSGGKGELVVVDMTPPVKRERGTSVSCPRCGSDLVVYRTQYTGHPHFCRRKRQYLRCMNAKCDYRSSRDK